MDFIRDRAVWHQWLVHIRDNIPPRTNTSNIRKYDLHSFYVGSLYHTTAFEFSNSSGKSEVPRVARFFAVIAGR
jgi:hypothetical protein